MFLCRLKLTETFMCEKERIERSWIEKCINIRMERSITRKEVL